MISLRISGLPYNQCVWMSESPSVESANVLKVCDMQHMWKFTAIVYLAFYELCKIKQVICKFYTTYRYPFIEKEEWFLDVLREILSWTW